MSSSHPVPLTVDVHLVDHVLQLRLGRVLAEGPHHRTELLRRDRPIPVLVEQRERLLELCRHRRDGRRVCHVTDGRSSQALRIYCVSMMAKNDERLKLVDVWMRREEVRMRRTKLGCEERNEDVKNEASKRSYDAKYEVISDVRERVSNIRLKRAKTCTHMLTRAKPARHTDTCTHMHTRAHTCAHVHVHRRLSVYDYVGVRHPRCSASDTFYLVFIHVLLANKQHTTSVST